MSDRLPTIFLGHGSSLIALQENDITQSRRGIAQSFPGPRTILCVSAHRLTRGPQITAQATPPPIPIDTATILLRDTRPAAQTISN